MTPLRVRPTAAAALLLAGAAVLAPGTRADDEPEYPHGDFDGDCTVCHRDDGWTPIRLSPEFRHADGRFPLVGAHEIASCRACHRTLDFSKTDPSCVACHADVHQGEFGTDCSRCHVPRTFIDRGAMVRRHGETRFPLRGVHLALDCDDCHRPAAQGRMQFVNTAVECVACHLAAYQGTTDPDHEAAGFPTDCALCHAPTAWDQGRFNHRLTTRPCVDCHLDDYQATTNPNHAALGFPTDCEACHTPTVWTRTADGFDHDGRYFPIYSGTHRGRWTACSDCHVNSSNFADFSCIQCHAHDDQASVASHHADVSGFSYGPQTCYTCHPTGRAGD